MKVRPLGAEFLHMDRQRDEQPGRHDEAHNPFLQFRKFT